MSAQSPSPATTPATGHDPWRRTSSRVVYTNPWIRVREDRVVRPDGQAGIYGVVELRNLALGCVPLFADGTTVLVGQHRYTLGAYSWEIPEGGGDPQRDPLAEIRRELKEETGLSAATWTPLGRVHTSNSVTDELGLLWLAEGLTEGAQEPDGTEVLQTWRLPLAEAVEMAADGRLTDSLTVAGLLRAADTFDPHRGLLFGTLLRSTFSGTACPRANIWLP
jgi:8-oxo-dGDP phosphatase